jgi:hypothetical protein
MKTTIATAVIMEAATETITKATTAARLKLPLEPGITSDFHPGTGPVTVYSIVGEKTVNAEAKFSPNIISLEINGPGILDLSFYDISGLIRSTPNEEDTYLVKVLENLAKEYIDHPDAIILWAVPMNLDPDNSST